MQSIESFLQSAITRFQSLHPHSQAAQDKVKTQHTLEQLTSLQSELRTKLGDATNSELPNIESSPNLLVVVNNFLLGKTTSNEIAKMIQTTLDE